MTTERRKIPICLSVLPGLKILPPGLLARDKVVFDLENMPPTELTGHPDPAHTFWPEEQVEPSQHPVGFRPRDEPAAASRPGADRLRPRRDAGPAVGHRFRHHDRRRLEIAKTIAELKGVTALTETRPPHRGLRPPATRPWLGLGLLALSSVAAPASAQVEPLDTCFLEMPPEVTQSRGADCGYAVVPQSRTGGAGEVRLAYMRLNAGTPSGAAPLFMLAGGPGQALTGDPGILALFQPELLGPILETRDIVLMEQRGTLRSRPYLDCPELWTAQREAASQRLDEDAGRVLVRARVSDCVARHSAEGVDLAAYNTLENAADVNDMRQALGYERIVFYGESYGSELGQNVMREFPGILEAVVLDGVASLTSTDWSAQRSSFAQWGIDNLTELCAADADCAASYDIPALLDAALAVFDDGPIETTYTVPDQTDFTFYLTLTQDEFASYLHGLQTERFAVMAFPALLNAYVTEGRDRIAADMAARRGAELLADPAAMDAAMAILMHSAMVCTDDPPVSADDVVTQDVSLYGRLFARNSAALYVELCDVLDLPQLPDRADALARVDVPTLVLSGGLDVQTPYYVSQEVVDALPDATHVIFPAGFHVQVMNLNRCAIGIMRDFVTDPSAQPDTACVAEAAPLPFMRPDFTMPEGD
jgi:pimeloyl-ACP methyl ester carboxylesterase